MKVLFFGYFTSVDALHGAELDLIQRHLDADDGVIMLYCDGNPNGCESNALCGIASCYRCVSKRKRGLRFFDGEVTAIPFLEYLTNEDKKKCDVADNVPLDSIDELKNWRVDNFDLGYGILSSLISKVRDAHVDLKLHGDYLRRMARSALTIYYAIRHYLESEACDKIYVMNGRLAGFRGAVRAGEYMRTPVTTYDEGQDRKHFALYENSNPHDLDRHIERMMSVWNKADEDGRREVGAAFFEERVRGKITGWNKGFVVGQKCGSLPESWDSEKRNIVIFDSSEDECASIGPRWDNPIYRDQLDALTNIFDEIKTRDVSDDLRFYIRMHPHMASLDNHYTRTVQNLGAVNIEIIPPQSKVSSYALLHEAEKILTFGSTVGIEAVYWRKPSILAAEAYYRSLEATHNPENHDELMRLLLDEALPCGEKDKTLIYGYYWKTFGEPYKYCAPSGSSPSDISFKGQAVKGGYWVHHGLRLIGHAETFVRSRF